MHLSMHEQERLLISLAAMVAPGGRAVGVDLSADLVEREIGRAHV